MRRTLIALTGLLAALGTAFGLTLAAGAASASVSPTTVYTTNGEAGYYAFGSDTGFSRVHSQIYIREYAANLPTTGAMGVQACNNNHNFAAQVGLVPNGTSPQTFTVRYATGSFSGPATDPCVGDGTLSGSSPIASSALQDVPLQNNLAFNIKNVGHHEIVISAQDLTTDTTDWSQLVSVPSNFWTEVGSGLQGNVSGLGGPASNELAAMRNVYAVDNAGHTGGLGNNANWTGVQVASSFTGTPPALITPASSLSGSVFKIFAATPVS